MRQVTEKLLKIESEYLIRINSLKNEIKYRKEALSTFIQNLKDAEEALSAIRTSLSSQTDVESVKKQIIKEAADSKKHVEEAKKAVNKKSKLSIIFKGGGWASQDMKREKERRSLNERF